MHSAFISGYVLSLKKKVLRTVRSNLGVSYALYDEGAFRNEKKNADLREAPEAIRFIESGLDPGGPEVTAVDINRYYGDPSARNLRVIFNEPLLHAFQPYSRKDLAHQLDFFRKVFDLPGSRPGEDQIWYWRELLSLLAFAAALVSLVPLTRLLLQTIPYFQILVHPVPEAPSRPTGRGRIIFWVLFLTGAVFACVSYIPFTELSQKLFPEASNRQVTWFFPQRMNNGVMLWAIFNGLIGFVLFYLGYRWHGRHVKPIVGVVCRAHPST